MDSSPISSSLLSNAHPPLLETLHPAPSSIHSDESARTRNNSNVETTSEKQIAVEGEQVDIQSAEKAFSDLRQALSRSSALHRTITGQTDAEKEAEHAEDFDLLEYLTSESEQRDGAGFKRKHLGVIWDSLCVKGVGGMKIYIRTFPDVVQDFVFWPYSFVKGYIAPYKPEPKNLLHRFDGSAKPGEMVLVLGRPGSGCSTFLKTITNQRGGYLAVDGDVSYGGISPEEIAAHYRGEVVYNQEDDIHHATLTVAQTVLFALNLKTPGHRLPNASIPEVKKQVLELLLKMLGISHTANTMVGSAYVRGVSGGERKRVSIAEMMTTRASVCSWDNSTRGLDASTALDYAKSLRILTDVFNVTTFVSLYQAGEGIYDQFDKVLLIDEGREVYFGPTSEARAYMTSLGYVDLPRQTTADYLTGCTDPNERHISPTHPTVVPTSSLDLETSFRSSSIHSQMMSERADYLVEVEKEKSRRDDFMEAVRVDKRRGVVKGSSYTVSFWTQVWSLTVRTVQIKVQDKLGIAVSFFTSVAIALISGSVYLALPTTSAGAFTRGGVMFISVLFNAFLAFNELPTQMMGRPIMFKQTSFAFYRPAALSLAATLAGAPISMVQILAFCVIIYFMAGLYTSGAAFVLFYIIVLVGFFALSALFRLLGTFCSSYDVAARLAAILITGMVLYSGYLIPVFSMKRWLFWIYYMNPLNYAFSAAMENEFSRIDLTCDGTYIVPYNIGNLTKYPTVLGPNQACTLPGSAAGNAIVTGSAYIKANFDYDVGDIGRNIGITILFFVAFNVMQAWAVEYFRHGADSPQINVFAREDGETKVLNEKLQAAKPAFRAGEIEQDLQNLVTSRKPFTWEALCYTVPVPGGKRQLLDNVYGYCKPGTLTALMGASGAGKTTLLDVLANRKNIGVIGGNILINGRKPGKDFQRGTAYVEQQDTHEWTSTIREAFRFSAYLRQPSHVSKAEKDAYVEEVIQLLELEDLADSMIGFPGFGLGVEARKRVTIGVELASKPQLLLFLDEPTSDESSLDGQSAYNIVRFLRKLAAAGQAILVTVHQPNSLLFEQFDRLLLLKSGGRCIYFGDIGKDSHIIRSYFAKHGALCPTKANPAEFMLEAIGAGSRRKIGKWDWADIFLESEELETVKAEIEELKKLGLSHAEDNDPKLQNEYATSFLLQLKVVVQRTSLSFWRNPNYGFTRLFNHIAIALFVGLTFLQLTDSLASLQYRVFAIFFVTVLPAVIIAQVEPQFIMARDIFVRESSSKMYSQPVFALAQISAEAPYSLLCAVCFFLLFYFPMGFNSSPDRAGYAFFMILITEFFAVTLGQGIAAISPSIFIAASQNPFILVIGSLFCGVTVPYPVIPYFWQVWMYPLDPYTRIISGMVANELYELPVNCLANEFTTFNPPAGQTCQQWAGDFVAAAGGYLQDGSLTSSCKYCTYKAGQEFYSQLAITFDTRWRDLGILICFMVFNAGLAVVASKYLRYSKR